MSIDNQAVVGAVKKYPILVVSGFVGLVILLGIYFRSDLLDAQQAELDKFSAESSRHRSNNLNAAQLQDQLDFMIRANAAIKERALNAEGLAQNLQYFYKLESDVGVKFLDLRPGPRPTVAATTKQAKVPAKQSPFVPLNYILNVEGDFSQVIDFLRRLEQGVYFSRINSATVSSTAGSVVVMNLNVDLLGVP